MIARFAIFILALTAIPLAAAASAANCDKNPTFLREAPGGHDVVFRCGCEPPPSERNPELMACGYPPEAPRMSALPAEAVDDPLQDSAALPVTRAVRFAPTVRDPDSSPGVRRPCVGLCYGVPSDVNGRARDTYVQGHFRKNGTYVAPYTRSSRGSSSRSGRRR
jgi:hypothetical protein